MDWYPQNCLPSRSMNKLRTFDSSKDEVLVSSLNLTSWFLITCLTADPSLHTGRHQLWHKQPGWTIVCCACCATQISLSLRQLALHWANPACLRTPARQHHASRLHWASLTILLGHLQRGLDHYCQQQRLSLAYSGNNVSTKDGSENEEDELLI